MVRASLLLPLITKEGLPLSVIILFYAVIPEIMVLKVIQDPGNSPVVMGNIRYMRGYDSNIIIEE